MILRSSRKELLDYTVTACQQLILLIILSNMIEQNTEIDRHFIKEKLESDLDLHSISQLKIS